MTDLANILYSLKGGTTDEEKTVVDMMENCVSMKLYVKVLL